MGDVIAHEERGTEHIKGKVVAYDVHYAETSITILRNIVNIIFRPNLNPIVVELKVNNLKCTPIFPLARTIGGPSLEVVL